MEPALHPDCEPIAFLLGTWRGEGEGVYPTIQTFRYGEEIRFWHVGKPFLAYQQRTWALDDNRPLHAEMGYWRPQPGGRLELTMAHPTGVAEIEEGTCREGRIDLATTSVVLTSSAKDVTALARILHVDGDTMTYTLRMAAVGEPLIDHLVATLKREG
jgi:hypothetical protein